MLTIQDEEHPNLAMLNFNESFDTNKIECFPIIQKPYHGDIWKESVRRKSSESLHKAKTDEKDIVLNKKIIFSKRISPIRRYNNI